MRFGSKADTYFLQESNKLFEGSSIIYGKVCRKDKEKSDRLSFCVRTLILNYERCSISKYMTYAIAINDSEMMCAAKEMIATEQEIEGRRLGISMHP